ncbi:orotate phosphoribosyltransferase [Thalassobacillus hwangdonensis]|uniref:Orotate phosphoribosyltransferase n=1 Tax=Thalassobacillus hwangdonensis TaxID=546108 RepID=A0ABW3KW68_9BACI
MFDNSSILSGLLEIGAVQIQPDDPFTLSSGLMSPIYCDNRLTMSYPEIRRSIRDRFTQQIKELGEIDVIAGCATAGIPHAAFVAEVLDLPMIYVRSKPKSHGKGSQIEGKLHKGQKVVLIEDLFSTGGSAIQAAEAIKEAGGEVVKIIAIFSYQLDKSKQNFKEAGFEVESLTDLDELLTFMKRNGGLSEIQEEKVLKWRKDPSGYKG